MGVKLEIETSLEKENKDLSNGVSQSAVGRPVDEDLKIINLFSNHFVAELVR